MMEASTPCSEDSLVCQDETKEEVYSKPQTYAETLKMSEPAKVFVLSLTKEPVKKAVVESETQSIAANPSLKSARTYAARTSENAARKRMQFRNRRRTWSKTRKLTKGMCRERKVSASEKGVLLVQIVPEVGVIIPINRVCSIYSVQGSSKVAHQQEKDYVKNMCVSNGHDNESNFIKASQCPCCDKEFVSDTQMLDHYIDVHRPKEQAGRVPAAAACISKKKRPISRHTNELSEELSYIASKKGGYSRRYKEQESDYPSEYGVMAGLNVCEWNVVRQLFAFTWLLGFHGFFHFLEESVLQIIDFSRLKLLLSGDIEQNPGPTMMCQWEGCSEQFNSLKMLIHHVIDHVSMVYQLGELRKACHWGQCVYMESEVPKRLQSHVLNHLYQEEYQFRSIDEWASALPFGKLENSTDLNLCPKYMRSQLGLEFFDSSFKIKQHPYTLEDHLQYVARLNLEDPVASTSKDSEPPVASTSKDLDTTIVPPSVINPNSSKKILCSVATTRPELSNNSGLSVLLKCSTVDSCSVVIKGKRKHQDDDKTEAEPWMETLCENLSSCLPGIEFESKVMTYLIGVKFLTPGSSAGKSPCSFFQFEEAVFKLAGIPDCSDGVFVYTVFEIQFTDEKQYYIKYFESGEYTGFMEQVCIHDIINYFQTKPESVFLSSIGTQFDITQSLMNRQETVNEAKRFRPAKLFNNNSKLAIENLEKCLKKSDETNAGLKGVFFHCASKDFKTKTVSLDGDQKDFQVKQMRMDYQFFNIQRSKLISFPLEKIVESDTSSSDFVKSVLPTETSKCLLKQSIALNSLSCATKKQITGKAGKGQRSETRFPHKNACSFRNKLFFYFMEHDSVSLKTYFKKCISASSETLFDDDTPREYPERPNKRRKVSDCVKTVTVTPDMIQKQTDFNPDFGLDSLSDSSLSIYDGFVRRLVAEKSIFIQIYRENETVKAVMNDYNCDDGRFKESAFVITSWNVTETGGYLTCSCRIYRTLLDLSNSTGSVTALDVQGATCMHCRFFKEIVLPNLNTKENENLSGKEHLIQNSLKYNNETIIEISSQRKTKKFSVIDSDALSFVNLTYNKRLDRYIASCEDGYCKSQKGSKKCVDNLMKGKHCPHLEILKCNPHFWNDFASSEDNVGIDNENEIEQSQVLRQDIDDVDEIQEDEVKVDCTYNFDPETGLWTFPCRSKHIPRNQNDIELQKNVRIRDNWNYMNLSKTDEGYLKGENLIPNIPVDNCSCKVGWHDEDRPEGIIKRSRTLVIYTSNAPVKCYVYNRFCLSSTCTQPWDEGKNLCIHVLSNETAAGDEIGWEYINSVLSGSITFSSFCRKKSKDYKMRNKFSHNFMDPNTFIKWWFSWASSLKIDFRKPCPVCQFEPKQLACDGTKVGIGFRHANFTDISKPDNENLIEPTIHRRLDRCFLSNDLSQLTNRNMNECRFHLNYLSKKALNELTDSEILTEEIEQEKNAVLVSILPAQVGHSFHRFLDEMLPKEKNAYASVMKMLSTTAPISSFLPSAFVGRLNRLINHMSHDEEHPDGNTFVNSALTNMRTYAPEIRLLIACSLECSANGELPVDIISFLQYLIGQSSELSTNTAEPADLQPGTYNPAKYGRAYYFSQSGEKLRNARKFSIDTKKSDNNPYDDPPADFDKCDKYFSKTSVSAKGTSNLFLWFCPIHGHCYGFHLTNAEGRKDPAASLYTHLKQPPQDIFYDFACNLQEYCLNRESDFYKDVRFFHDIFHGFSHKCSTAYRSSRLHGFECINSEICEQFNSFIQCIKPSGRQMSQEHFCFYLQFFLNIWNEEKYEKFQQRLHVAQAGLLPHS